MYSFVLSRAIITRNSALTGQVMTEKSGLRLSDDLRDVVHLLKSLNHDEHRDLVDMLSADIDPINPPRRKGRPPVNPANGHRLILSGGWQYRDNPPLRTRAARNAFVRAYKAASNLSDDFKRVIIDFAYLLKRANSAVPERRRGVDGKPIAEGTIQTKIIRRKIVDPETGAVEIKPFGPYLYYRFLASGGDADKRKSRLKNKYIGRIPLAQMFDRTPAGSTERRDLERRIIEAFKAGTLDTLMMDMGIAVKDYEVIAT